MNKLFLTAVASLFVANLAFSPTAMAGAQQDKMKECNVQAAGKKGDERKKFMKECLSAKKVEEKSAKTEEKTGKTPQQEKMKACNKEAGDKKLKGGERRKFMSDCLKG
jgi:psiF repeat